MPEIQEAVSIVFTNKRTLCLLSCIMKTQVLRYRNKHTVPVPKNRQPKERHIKKLFQYKVISDTKEKTCVGMVVE